MIFDYISHIDSLNKGNATKYIDCFIVTWKV